MDLDANTPGYSWLDDNAARFGFVPSYPEHEQKTTGYIHEWWHFRYVGTQVARAAVSTGTLEAWFRAHADRVVAGDCSDCATGASRT